MTTSIQLTLELPEDVERKARETGLLTSEGIERLLTAELERQRREAAGRITETMDKLSASFRAEFPDLTEEEALAMIDQWIDEADEEAEATGDSAPR